MPWHMKRRICMPIGGAIIFGSIFFELSYVWDSIWGNRLYAMFGSLLLVMALLVFVIGELSVVHTYLLLQHGNPDWQWRSFMLGASGGLYFFLYANYYALFVLQMNMWTAEAVYFIWSCLIGICFMFFCGATSTLASACFVSMIYSQTKNHMEDRKSVV